MRKHHNSIDKISKNCNQFAVVTRLKIFPTKISILSFRCDRSQHIPKNILFTREGFEIVNHFNTPLSAGTHLITL